MILWIKNQRLKLNRLLKPFAESLGMAVDKLEHNILLFVIVLVVGLFFSLITAIITGIAVAVLIELFDKFIKKTYFSFPDLLADYQGMLLGIIVLTIIKSITKYIN